MTRVSHVDLTRAERDIRRPIGSAVIKAENVNERSA